MSTSRKIFIDASAVETALAALKAAREANPASVSSLVDAEEALRAAFEQGIPALTEVGHRTRPRLRLVEPPTPSQQYKHYKGGVYDHICEGLLEATLEPHMVYRGEDARIWVRPKSEFLEKFSRI